MTKEHFFDKGFSVLIVGASPDHLNNNAVMRSYVLEGFQALLGEGNAWQCSLEAGAETVRRLQPKLVVCFGSCMPDVVNYSPLRQACDSTGIGLAFWLHDDPYEFDFGYRATAVADWLFSNDRWAALHHKHPRAFHLPMAASPSAHMRDWNPHKENDIFFCGVAFSNRVQMLKDLSTILRKYRTRICGAEWPTSMEFTKNERLKNDQLADAYASSWLTLNIGRNLHLANHKYQLDPSTPGPRTFEAALAGTVQIYFADSLEITDYFEPDNEIILFDNPVELASQLERLLHDKKQLQVIIEAARERARQCHTYENRARSMLNLCGYKLYETEL